MRLDVAGRRLFVATGGRPFDPSGPVLVLVHGAGMDHTVWSMQARYFAHHGYSVFSPDLPGHGRSDGPSPATIPEHAERLAEVLEVAGVGAVHIAGHSMGSLIALALASAGRISVTKLALLGTAAHIRVAPALLEAARRGEHTALESIIGWGVGRRAQIGGNRAPGLWIAGSGMRLLETARQGVLAGDLAACNDWTDGLSAAAGIDCPALLLLGSDDRMTPRRAALPLADAITDCRIRVLPGAGHMMMTEQPDETLDCLEEFLSS